MRSTTANRVPVSVRIIAVLRTRSLGEQLTIALRQVQGVQFSLRYSTEAGALRAVGEEEQPDLIVLELDGDNRRDIEEIERIRRQFGDAIRIFVIHGNGDAVGLERIKRLGIRHLHLQPVDMQSIVLDVVEYMSEKRTRILEAQLRPGSLTLFLSARGGSGSSLLASNVAVALSRLHQMNVALVDLDLQFGAVSMLLDLAPKADVTTALYQADRIDPVFVKALMTRHESGVDVLPAPADFPDLGLIEDGATTLLLNALLDRYDMIILDAPRGFSAWVVEALRMANPLVLVGQSDLVTLRDMKLILEKLPTLGIAPEHVEIVINRVTAQHASVDIEEIQRVLGVPQLHRVASDFATAVTAQDRGQTVWDVNRKSVLTRDIERLAEHLAWIHSGSTRERQGFMARLFGRR